MASLDEITVPVKVALEVTPPAENTLTLLFCSSHDPISWGIRKLTWSDWSHVVVIAPNGVDCYEATYPLVRKCTLQDILNDNDVVVPKVYSCQDPETAIAWCATQEGLPYDVQALIGFMAERDWAEPGSWFCSEYAAMAFDKGRTPKIQRGASWRVTPQNLWMLPGLVGSPYRCRSISPWPVFVKDVEKLTSTEFVVKALELGSSNVLHTLPIPAVLPATVLTTICEALPKEKLMAFTWSHFKDLLDHFTSVASVDTNTALDFASSAAPILEALPDGAAVNGVIAGLKAVSSVITPISVAAAALNAPTVPGAPPSMTGAQAATTVAAVVNAVQVVQAELPK